jgi:hypothetical protein
MYKRDRNTGKQTQGDEALLTVGEPVVFEREGDAFEHARGIDEIEPMSLRFAARFASDLVNSMRAVYIHYVVASTR